MLDNMLAVPGCLRCLSCRSLNQYTGYDMNTGYNGNQLLCQRQLLEFFRFINRPTSGPRSILRRTNGMPCSDLFL